MSSQAFKRLKEMPEVMTVNTITAMLKTTPKAASVYIARWREAGMIASMGERTGVHFNLVRNPNAPEERFYDAIKLLFPEAVITGASAIHSAGWTTQIPRSLEIAILRRPSAPQIPGVEVQMRPRRWFAKVHDSLIRQGTLPTLHPAHGLADCWKRETWQPDPDEIEWDEVRADALREAFRLHGVEIPEDYLEELEELDSIQERAPGF